MKLHNVRSVKNIIILGSDNYIGPKISEGAYTLKADGFVERNIHVLEVLVNGAKPIRKIQITCAAALELLDVLEGNSIPEKKAIELINAKEKSFYFPYQHHICVTILDGEFGDTGDASLLEGKLLVDSSIVYEGILYQAIGKFERDLKVELNRTQLLSLESSVKRGGLIQVSY